MATIGDFLALKHHGPEKEDLKNALFAAKFRLDQRIADAFPVADILKNLLINKYNVPPSIVGEFLTEAEREAKCLFFYFL